MIPFSPPDISDLEIGYVCDALRSGWITTGPKTKELEKKLAAFCQTSTFCCLNSATAALELCLRVLGIGEGDEVITSAYTYTASCSPIVHVGATPVLVDVAPGSFLIDIDKVGQAVTSKTKAVIPVDIGGSMLDYDRLFDVLEEKQSLYSPSNEIQSAFDRVIVIADAAHALGSSYKGRVCGSVADFTTFSFHAVKNFTTAEGGGLTWKKRDGIDDEWLYNQIQLFSLHGQNKDALAKTKLGAWEYDIVFPGYKCNMTDIMAALGLGQLERYPSLLDRRAQIISMYEAGLSGLPISTLKHDTQQYHSCGHLFLMRIDGYTEKKRNAFITSLAENGVASNVHYKPLPMHTGYKKFGFRIEDYPNSYAQYCNEVTLPLHTKLSDDDLATVIKEVRSLIVGA